MMHTKWKQGDWAIYRKSKRSPNPGKRAADVVATPKGEMYTYVVDKFWVVETTLPGDRLRLRTARGKVHEIAVDDPNLRRPTWLQRVLFRNRFRAVEQRIQSPTVAA